VFQRLVDNYSLLKKMAQKCIGNVNDTSVGDDYQKRVQLEIKKTTQEKCKQLQHPVQ